MIQDAFHNIPAGSDRRKYTVAAAEHEDDEMSYIIYNVLVFRSRSSPTLWGRYGMCRAGVPIRNICGRPTPLPSRSSQSGGTSAHSGAPTKVLTRLPLKAVQGLCGRDGQVD